mgnify:CR=1 FL=1
MKALPITPSNPLSIIYQDNDYVVIDKPKSMLVHPVKDPHPDKYIAMKVIRDQLGQLVYTVHRLDRPTSGLLLFALNVPAVQVMQKMFENKQVQKKYIAIVVGKTPQQWINETALIKPENGELKSASTAFKLITYLKKGTFDFDPNLEVSILEASPHSGRFHQIRRHLAGEGTAIIGDYLHGNIEQNDLIAEHTNIKRMMLMANQLEFIHPFTSKLISINLELDQQFMYYKNLILK